MMRMSRLAALTLVLAAPSALAAKDQVAHVYGPPPTWEAYRQLAEADIARRLVDPDSAKITWLGQYRKDEWKPFLQGRVAGYIACGTVNARNRMGGYAGAVSFVVVIDYGRVLFAELDSRGGGMVAESCNKALAAGVFPPLPADENGASLSDATTSATTSATTTAGSSGLTLRTMPDGAYITAVTPGSPAAAAALAPGMVIASVNAIPLAGMGDAMGRIVDAAGPGATLTLIGGKAITLGKKP
jgi:hypothetical protein